jgi:hypothetical protein
VSPLGPSPATTSGEQASPNLAKIVANDGRVPAKRRSGFTGLDAICSSAHDGATCADLARGPGLSAR